MRRRDDLVARLERHRHLVLDLTGDLNEARFVQRFGDGFRRSAAAEANG